ncbi:MAG: rRNA maturation RNase YbeY [Micrococcales bacterium]
MSIEVNNDSGQVVDELRALRLAEFALNRLHIDPKADLAIVFVDIPTMSELHVQWMDEEGPTDVLSFPMDELRIGSEEEPSMGLLGDIVVCPEYAQGNAEKAGHPLMNEILLLITHGILHLLGFDHVTPEEEADMFGLQREILDAFYAAEVA